MNEDSRKRSSIKHYQNSDYPSGSFEAAIQADREAELRSSAHLRLERHPSAETDDIEEMVPDFMHRDFFRSEEDAIDAIKPSSRLRVNKKSRKGPLMVPRGPASGLSDPVAGYVAPPVTEHIAASDVPISVRSAASSSISAGAARAEQPLTPLRAVEPAIPSESHNSALRSTPLSDSLTPPEPIPSGSAARLARDHSGPGVSPPARGDSVKASSYSVPLVVALLLVMGLFLWREQTRPDIVPPEVLAVPATLPLAQDAAPPTPTAFLVVGPPVPSGAELVQSEQVPSDEVSPSALGVTDESSEAADDLAQRAAILERMTQSTGAESSPSAPTESSEDLPWEAPPLSESVRQAPGLTKAPAAVVRPSGASAAPQAAPKPAAAKKAPLATAADLFPIDEELPLNNPVIKTPPSVARPAPAPVPVSAPVSAPVGAPDGYQIAEPNL